MTAKQLYNLIDSLSMDIEFSYNGNDGVICPYSRNDISIGYNNQEKSYTSIQDAMEDKFFDGKSLNEISDQLIYA